MRRCIIVCSLVLVPLLGAWIPRQMGRSRSAVTARQAESAIIGMWSRFHPDKEGDPQRFYYFHTGGIGLFRYGRMGLTYTQTFRYDVDAEMLKLTFNKTGRTYEVPYRLDGESLTLMKDPRMGGEHVYTKRPRPTASVDHEAFDHPFARLWVQKPQGGSGDAFRMYQLQAPTIDGRGVGWYHEGDFHEWSTETLQYRRTGDRLSLVFPVRNEKFVTDLTVRDQDGTRTLSLAEDPRNYWHPRTYRDGGPGFTMQIAGAPLPYHVPGHGRVQAHGCPHAP